MRRPRFRQDARDRVLRNLPRNPAPGRPVRIAAADGAGAFGRDRAAAGRGIGRARGTGSAGRQADSAADRVALPAGPVRRGAHVTSTRWWRLVAGTAAGLLVVVALLVTALRIAIAYVPQNEQKLRTWIERQTHMKFEYSRLDARLRWYGPEVVLRDLRVLDADGSQALFATREGSVGLDLWNFLRTGQFVAGRVYVQHPRVTIVRLPDGRIRLLGLRERPADKPPFDFDRLPAGRVVIEDAIVVFRDLKTGRPPFELKELDVLLRRDRDFVVMEGGATLPSQLGRRADFEVRLKGTLDEREHLDARVEV